MMRVLVAVAIVLGIALPSAHAADDKALAALNAALVERDVLPRVDRFAEATAALVPAADAYCSAPGAAGLNALKRAYNGAADAWQGVQHFRFGPMELLLRTQRIAFWPDPRNAVGRQLAEVIAARDVAALTPQAFAQGRVTIQGLPAMERLFYDDGAAAKLESGPEAGFRCEMLRAIAHNLAGIGTDMRGEWRGGAKPYASVMTTYGPDAHYRTAQEATLDLFKSLYTAVEIVADHKLGKPLGASLADARPTLAESVRSGRSLRNVQLNLEAGAALYRAGMDAYLRDVAKDPALAAAIAQAFDKAIADAKAVSVPVETAVRDSSRRAAVEKTQRDAAALKTLLAQKLSPALGIPVGFNALDGD
ncbi:MAG: imelysin family protein [Alphaproteobacteria bacterium]